jgi:hypothetical protein
MTQIIKFPLESGGFVYAEVANVVSEDGLVRAGIGFSDAASKSFESALNNLSPIANTIISKLNNIAIPPDEASVEFGLALRADASVAITKMGTEANFKINLKWVRERS